MNKTCKTLLTVAGMLPIVSCDVLDPPPPPVAGVLAFHEMISDVTVPDAVAAGSPFEVRVVTFGGGCIRKERTDLTVHAMVADVFVYDRDSGDGPCADILRPIEHRATVTFAQPGVGTVRFHGWRIPQNDYFVLERTVIVL